MSRAFTPDLAAATWAPEARTAKRHAANVAIAIDGMTDRCVGELGLSKESVRKAVSALCVFPGTEFSRTGAIERIRGVANAYKHENLRDATLPITSDRDILVVGTAYGVEAYGAGKWGGCPEVIVHDKAGEQWKFLADAPAAINAWMRFLKTYGATLPDVSYRVGGFQLRP